MPDYSTFRLLVRENLLSEAAVTPKRVALDGLSFRAMKTRCRTQESSILSDKQGSRANC